jgi:hypothetical protein
MSPVALVQWDTHASFTSASPRVHLSICESHSNFDVRLYVTTLGGDAHFVKPIGKE